MFHKFSFDISREKIKKQFNLPIKQELTKSFHISAMQHAYVLSSESAEMFRFKWGLIPYWAKDPDTVEHLITAMAEGLESKDSFRMPFRQKRCIVFADSYYETLRKNKKDQYYRILLKNQGIMAFAAIWDLWTDPNGKDYYSFSIITTEAGHDLKKNGWNRMPLIFTTEEQINKWLDKEMPLQKLISLLNLPSDVQLLVYPVSDALKDPKNDYPELHREISLED